MADPPLGASHAGTHRELVAQLLQCPLEVLQRPSLQPLLSAHGETERVIDAASYFSLVSERIQRCIDAALQGATDPSASAADALSDLQSVLLVGTAALLVFAQQNLTG